MTIGVRQKPVWRHELPSTAWQLLWWMICVMDDKQELRGGWRIAAARALHRDRIWVAHCGGVLVEHGFIDAEPGRRYAKVLVGNIIG